MLTIAQETMQLVLVCLPIDLIFGTNPADLKGSSITYIETRKRRIEWAYQTANEVIKKEQERNK